MIKRIAAIAFIFICTCVAWAVLGGTIMARTYSTDASLRGQVQSLWGTPQKQLPPSMKYDVVTKREEVRFENKMRIVEMKEDHNWVHMPLTMTRVNAHLKLNHRQKGLLWYSTYQVDFTGEYAFPNDKLWTQAASFKFPFPAQAAVYDNVTVSVNGVQVPFTSTADGIEGTTVVAAGQTARLRVTYRSQGLDSWTYDFGGQGVHDVRDFDLRMTTDFPDIDFPAQTLSPTEKHENAQGWELRWNYTSLLSGTGIGMVMPEKLQPGPLAGQISFFAPVSLFFFFFLMFIITTLRNIDLHPMNYFFLATAFFAFHLLLAYLVDHISIHLAFVICSAVSIFLVISYLRLVVGMRFAAVEAGISQFVYLVLFSYAFFFKGFTGLAVTIGAILTLFLVMQMTGKIRWEEKFRAMALPARGNLA